MISIIILTKNEENDLPRCLESLGWCDDVHVVDSGSTDGTRDLAAAAGALVYQNPFRSFGDQRNWALARCRIRYSWILFLDADEQATPEFATRMRSAVAHAAADVAGFFCCWKLMLGDTWLKRSDGFPRWQFRLLRRGAARFCDAGHGQKEADVQGRIEFLREPYLHFAFSKGWTHWLDRHNRYSSQEAATRLASSGHLSEVFRARGSHRTSALKAWLSRRAGWPVVRFFHSFIFRLGFLEGRAALVYCTNMAYYEFLIGLKMAELREAAKPDDTAE